MPSYMIDPFKFSKQSERLEGETAIAERHEALAEKIRAGFQREFITTAGRLLYNSQGAYVFAFAAPSSQCD